MDGLRTASGLDARIVADRNIILFWGGGRMTGDIRGYAVGVAESVPWNGDERRSYVQATRVMASCFEDAVKKLAGVWDDRTKVVAFMLVDQDSSEVRFFDRKSIDSVTRRPQTLLSREADK